MDNNYSLSDLATITRDGDFGGGMWLILLIVLLFGGNFGYRNGELGQYATAASQQEILFGQKFSSLDNKIDRLGNGIADATYALNNSIQGEGRNIQTQLANCCCENQKNVDSVRFDMANYHADTNAVTVAQTQKILDTLAQNKIDSLQSQVGTLQNQLALQQAMCGVPKINPYMYGIVPTYSGCNCNCGNI